MQMATSGHLAFNEAFRFKENLEESYLDGLMPSEHPGLLLLLQNQTLGAVSGQPTLQVLGLKTMNKRAGKVQRERVGIYEEVMTESITYQLKARFEEQPEAGRLIAHEAGNVHCAELLCEQRVQCLDI